MPETSEAKKNSASGKLLTNAEISAFCGQMNQILHSGLSAADGLSVMLEDAEDVQERTFLSALLEDVEENHDFPAALERAGIFPDYMVSMTRIGAETGSLDQVMGFLSTHYEREDAIRRSIRSAITYPVVMMVMMLAVIVVLLVKVMPIFNGVFIQLGTEMTGVSRALMNVGSAISRYGVVLMVLLAVAAAILVWCSQTAKGRSFALRAGYRMGFAKHILDDVSACRLAGGLALTLSSGLTHDRCMELAGELVGTPEFETKLNACRESIESGEDMAKALHTSGIFSGLYSRIAIVGEKTGNLERAMDKIAGMYQDEVDSRINNMLSVLEPAMVIILSVIVGAILLSVMLPLLGIMSGI